MCGCLLCAPSKGTWPAIQACALTRNRTGDLLVCRLVLNPLSHTSQSYLFTFKERGREEETERNMDEQERYINQLPLPHHPPTRDQTHNLGMFPDWELNL